MFVDTLFDGNDQVALRQAFDRASSELGIGTNSDDADRREHLARLILGLAREGESEPTSFRAKPFGNFDIRKMRRPVRRPLSPNDQCAEEIGHLGFGDIAAIVLVDDHLFTLRPRLSNPPQSRNALVLRSLPVMLVVVGLGASVPPGRQIH